MENTTTVKGILVKFERYLEKIANLNIFDSLLFNYKFKFDVFAYDIEEQFISLTRSFVDDIRDVTARFLETYRMKRLEETSAGANTETDDRSFTKDAKEVTVKKKLSCRLCYRKFASPVKHSAHELKCSKQSDSDSVKDVCKQKPYNSKVFIDGALPFYSCESCFYVFTTTEKFDTHVCGDTFDTADSHNVEDSLKKLVDKLEELRNLKKFVCSVCCEEYRSVERMSYHLPRCKPPPYQCELCLKLYPSKRDLNWHKKQDHRTEKSFFCDECDLVFKLHTSLQKHKIQRHETEQGPFLCDEEGCQMRFMKRILLTNHKILEHKLEKKYLCQVCGNKFCTKNSLVVHLRMHEGNKMFVCTLCSKSFRQKEKLTFHVRTHTGERPYLCQACGKSFIRKSKLDDHIRRHRGEKRFQCPFCSKQYAASFDLKTHVRTKHKKESTSVESIADNSEKNDLEKLNPILDTPILIDNVQSSDGESKLLLEWNPKRNEVLSLSSNLNTIIGADYNSYINLSSVDSSTGGNVPLQIEFTNLDVQPQAAMTQQLNIDEEIGFEKFDAA